MHVHYTNDYQSSLLGLHIRLIYAFITQMITGMVYCHTTLKLLALATELSGSGKGPKTIEGMEKIIVL